MRYLLALLSISFALEVGKVEDFKGGVDKLEKDQVRPQPLIVEKAGLSIGDIIRTKSDGNAKISFVDGNKVEIGPLTRLSVLNYEKEKTINVGRGRVIFDVAKLKAGEGLEIRTPTAILGVKGTRFLVDVTPTSTVVVVFSGAVQVSPINNPTLTLTATPGTVQRISTTNIQTQNLQTEPPTRLTPAPESQKPPTPEITPPCVR
ncbi:MAG: FecR domain-containing protein [Aquificaceae bacterium]